MVMEVVPEDSGDGSMVCRVHQGYKNNSSPPGGICALCLQDKLGKLVSSSFPSSIFPSTSSSPPSQSHSPSPSSSSLSFVISDSVIPPPHPPIPASSKHSQWPKLSFLHKNSDKHKGIVFHRSKSTAVTRRVDFPSHDFSPKRKGFWSYLGWSAGTSFRQRSVREDGGACFSGDDERRVARSRSVGCGSRSFSGDFFERISTFGDCTLRRVESQREGKVKNTPIHGGATGDRVKCGGIFGGFSHAPPGSAAGAAAHGRSRSWGWAFASPMRAFSKRESGGSKRNANATPNLGAIPSLLAVGG